MKCSTKMLFELALSPAVFRADAYKSRAVADLCLRSLADPLLEDCIVRNLHNGNWRQEIQMQLEHLDPRAKELFKKLDRQCRLVQHQAIGDACPTNDEEWEIEAIDSHEKAPVSGLIFTQEAKNSRYCKHRLVACPEKLSNADFWKNRPCSTRIPRSIISYFSLLELVLRHANWIAFVDPHLDPSKVQYKDFIQLLTHTNLTERTCKPEIEIHRVAWLGNSKDKRPRSDEIKEIFCANWSRPLERQGVKCRVFLWDDFHDRFVASNLISMNWSNGFDTTSDPNERVTVGRLSRKDKDDLQKEFNGNSVIHRLQSEFEIG